MKNAKTTLINCEATMEFESLPSAFTQEMSATPQRFDRSILVKWLTGVLLIFFLFCFLFSFSSKTVEKPQVAARTTVVDHLTNSNLQSIETIRLGQRVATDITPQQLRAAIGAQEELTNWDHDAIDPETWHAVLLEHELPDGHVMNIELLRPDYWFSEQEASVGSVIQLSVEELGLDGSAKITKINKCPPIAEGNGQVVTGLFRHHRGGVLQLDIQDIAAPIGVTDTHPIYSIDRQEFIKAGDLKIGEALQLQYQTTRLVSVGRLPDQIVYNLEVQTEHVFRVSSKGLLVHNATSCKSAAENLPQLKGKSEHKVRKALEDAGFARTKVSNSVARNETWNHPDGSEVRIHPYGNLNEAPYRSANNAHIHKQDPIGNQLNDRGLPSSVAADTHIGIPNPSDLPVIRGRPHGTGTE